MERILVLLFALFSLNTFAAVPAGVPLVGLGGVSVNLQPSGGPQISDTALGTWFGIDCSYNNPTSGRFFACRKSGVKYQVTNGKTAWCTSLSFTASGTNQWMQFVSDTSTFDNATSLVAGVFEGGASANYSHVSASTAILYNNENFLYSFGSLTWVGVQLQNGASSTWFIHALCREI